MRIIAGSKRGMKLLSPAGRVSRPITDRVKESLFSILYKYDLPADAIVADLFCGVGSLGLEALSRGADFVIFVERDANIITTLKKNIEKAGFTKCSKVIKADALQSSDIVVNSGLDKSNLVFVDPPYAMTRNVQPGSLVDGLMNLLGEQIAIDGIVVIRTALATVLPERYGQLRVIEKRQWGTMACTFYTRARK